MSDYSFMRSGFDNIQDAVDEEEMKKNIVAIIVKFSEGAMRTAAKYVSHSQTRNVVTPEDLKRGMMLEMFLFKHRNNLLHEVEVLKEELFNEDDEDDEGEYGYDGDSDDDEPVEFSENACTCPICNSIKNIYTTWASLEPSSTYESLLKQHIESMC